MPDSAITPNTQLRWYQHLDSGAEYDHWGLDNIRIIQVDTNYHYIWQHNGFAGRIPPAEFPKQDTTYTVLYTNGYDSCFASVQISVSSPVIQADAGIDTSICVNNCIQLQGMGESVSLLGQLPEFQQSFPIPISGTVISEIIVSNLNFSHIHPGSIESVCLILESGFIPGTGSIDNITVALVCPDGNQLLLTQSGTGASYGLTGQPTCFTLHANSAISSGTSPYIGSYLPDSNGSLNDLAGCLANGTWGLKLINSSFPPSLLLLSWWSITFNNPAIPIKFSWSPVSGLNDPNILNPIDCPSLTTTYRITVSDSNNCTTVFDEVTVTVDNNPNCCVIPAGIFIGNDTTIGQGASLTLDAGAGYSNYLWSDNSTTQTITVSAPGIYSVTVTDIHGCTASDAMELSGGCSTQEIDIQYGWSMISAYIQPHQPDMLDILDSISTFILLIKNGAGQTAIPSLSINSIGNWNVTEGYKVKSSSATTLLMGCQQAYPGNTPIPLNQGWSLISYLRTSDMDISAALSPILANVLIVKNGSGGSFIPSFGINTIGNMQPGQGYKVKMSNAANLTYPGN